MKHAVCLAALLLAPSCTPVRPQVSLEPGASLAGYRLFLVAPVTDETGSRFNLNITDSLREQIVRRLRSHGLAAGTEAPPDAPGPVLHITGTLVEFRGMGLMLQLGGPGVSGCTLVGALRDATTGQRVGRIVASVLEEHAAPLLVLHECAHDLADAIDREMRREEKKRVPR